MVEHLAPPPAGIAAPAPMAEFFPTALAVIAARAPVVEFFTPTHAGTAVPAPVEKYIAPDPAIKWTGMSRQRRV